MGYNLRYKKPNIKLITENSHSKTVGKWIKGDLTVGNATTGVLSDVVGVVTSIVDSNNYEIQTSGFWLNGSLTGSSGDNMYLANDGTVANTPGTIFKELGVKMAGGMLIDIKVGLETGELASTVDITIPDNNSSAYLVEQTGNEYIKISTIDGSEKVTIGNSTTNPRIVIDKQNIGTQSLLTLSANTSGAITVTKNFHKVVTYAAASAGDLLTINGGSEGDELILKASDITKVVTLKKKGGTGNLDIPEDYALDSTYSMIKLVFDGTNWCQLSAAKNPKSMCKAWVNFDGTTANPCTIRDSYNVSSVIKNGTGNYTVVFTKAMSSTNYIAIPGVSVNSTYELRFGDGYDKQTTQCQVQVFNNNASAQTDISNGQLLIFGA